MANDNKTNYYKSVLKENTKDYWRLIKEFADYETEDQDEELRQKYEDSVVLSYGVEII